MSTLSGVPSHDEARPNDVLLHFVDGRVHRMQLDSPEAALSWIREIQAALFSFRNSAKAVRFNIPLRSITDLSKQPYLAFGFIYTIVFDRSVGDHQAQDDEDIDGTRTVESEAADNELHFYSARYHVFSALFRRARDEAIKKPIPEGMSGVVTSVGGLCGEQDWPERAKERTVEQSSITAKFRETFALVDDPAELKGKVS
jgi:hypothetical protein